MKLRDKPDPGRYKKSLPMPSSVKTLLVWAGIILLTVLVIRACADDGDGFPKSIYKYSCKSSPVWRLGGCNHVYSVVDCEGNIWWLLTSGSEETASVIKEQILFTAKNVMEAAKIMQDTIDEHKIPAKKGWWE